MNYLPAVAVIGLHSGSFIIIVKPKGIWASCVTRTVTAGRTRPVTMNGTPAQADNRFADNNSTIHPVTDSHDAFHTAGTCGDWGRDKTPGTAPPADRQGPRRPAQQKKNKTTREEHKQETTTHPATS